MKKKKHEQLGQKPIEELMIRLRQDNPNDRDLTEKIKKLWKENAYLTTRSALLKLMLIKYFEQKEKLDLIEKVRDN
jgi:hypothetical protein